MFADLLQLNAIHEKIMTRTFFGRKETSWLYNLLPTTAKKEMDFFQEQWKLFNMRAIREAETVSPRHEHVASRSRTRH
jgi:hypothetical protein